MDLKIRQLEVFKAVMETGSVTAAAARLQCTQPAVSVALAKFERTCGVALFDRRRGRFAPTAAAEALLAEVDRGLSGLGRIAHKARELREGAVGHLAIGCDGETRFMSSIIATFQRDRPDVTIELFQRSSKEIVTWIGGQQIDLGLVEMPVHWPGVAYEPFTQACVCLVPAGHRLADLTSITPADLDGEPVIGIAAHHPIDVQLAEVFAASGHTLVSRISGAYFETCRHLVRNGAGVAIVDRLATVGADDDGVAVIPFEPLVTYEMAIVYPARPGPAPIATEFMALLRTSLAPYRLGERDAGATLP